MSRHEPKGGLDRRLRPAADGPWLEILLHDPPALAEIAPDLARPIEQEGRRAGETIGREKRRRHTRERAPARTVLHHGRMVDAAQHLAARAVIFGGAERVARLLRREAEPSRRDRRAAERVPGAGGVIIRRRRMERDAGAERDLVAHHQRGEEAAPLCLALAPQIRHGEAAPATGPRRHGPWSDDARHGHRRHRWWRRRQRPRPSGSPVFRRRAGARPRRSFPSGRTAN